MHGRKQKPSGNCLGFTLIEIMLVIAVVGVLAAVTIPKYNAVANRYRLEASAQQVAGSLRYAKQAAMDQRKFIAIALNTNYVQSYEITYTKDIVTGLLSFTGTVPLGAAVQFESAVTFTAGQGLNPPDGLLPESYVYYDNKGFPHSEPGSDPSQPVTISLSKAGQTITIQIIPQTGYVSVY